MPRRKTTTRAPNEQATTTFRPEPSPAPWPYPRLPTKQQQAEARLAALFSDPAPFRDAIDRVLLVAQGLAAGVLQPFAVGQEDRVALLVVLEHARQMAARGTVIAVPAVRERAERAVAAAADIPLQAMLTRLAVCKEADHG